MKVQRDQLGDHSFKHERLQCDQQRDHPGNQLPVQLYIVKWCSVHAYQLVYSDNL